MKKLLLALFATLTFTAHAADITGAGADWFSVPGMGLSIVNQGGKDTWPVTTASFIIMYKDPVDKNASAEVLNFLIGHLRTVPK